MTIKVVTTIREQIIAALLTALGKTAGAPTGLTIHRERTRPIESDSLPAIMVYCDDEEPKPLGKVQYRAPLTERQLSIALECRAQGDGTMSPDQALDPILIWAAAAVAADESFGGLANGLEEGKTVWASREGDAPIAAAKWNIIIKYRTSRLDPTSQS